MYGILNIYVRLFIIHIVYKDLYKYSFKPAQGPIIGSFLCCIFIIYYHPLPSILIYYFLSCQSQSPVTFFLQLCILPQQNAEVAKNLKSPGLSLNASLMFSLVLFSEKRKALLLISFSNFFTGIYLAHLFFYDLFALFFYGF